MRPVLVPFQQAPDTPSVADELPLIDRFRYSAIPCAKKLFIFAYSSFLGLQIQKDLLQTKAAKGLDISQRTGSLGYLRERIDDVVDL